MNGTALEKETFVAIRWGWAAFLAVQMVVSYAFLAVTMYRTSRMRVPVLKSSELATLLSPTDQLREAVGSLDDMKAADRKSRGVTVGLRDDRLVLIT